MPTLKINSTLRADISSAEKAIPSEFYPTYKDYFVKEIPVSSITEIHNISKYTAYKNIKIVRQIMQKELAKYKPLLLKPSNSNSLAHAL